MVGRNSSTALLFAFCLFCGSAAFADTMAESEATKATPPASVNSTSETTKTTTTESSASDATKTTTTESTSSSTSTLSAPVATEAPKPTDPNVLLYADNVAPGPYEGKRKLLLASIKMAKKQGFGITAYLSELSKIEDQVKAGNTGPQLESRIDSIAEGLQDQLKRSQVLKTQHPTAGGGSYHSSSSSTSVSTSDSGRPHRSTDQLINELRQKYGDKIPSGMDNAELKEKLMKSDMAKEYLKRLGQ